jgi:hypothetical protein
MLFEAGFKHPAVTVYAARPEVIAYYAVPALSYTSDYFDFFFHKD